MVGLVTEKENDRGFGVYCLDIGFWLVMGFCNLLDDLMVSHYG